MIKNARILSATLGQKDHGIRAFMIYIDADGFSRGFARIFKTDSMEVISKILNVVGVNNWEDLPGKYIRFEDNGRGSGITKIGNIIKDKWALCLNAVNDQDIADQVYFSGKDASVEKVLFGQSTYEQGKEKDI